jgi:hypothetical protein
VLVKAENAYGCSEFQVYSSIINFTLIFKILALIGFLFLCSNIIFNQQEIYNTTYNMMHPNIHIYIYYT